VQQLAARRSPNRQLGIPDSRVRRVQLPHDKLGATANRSAANIRITIVSLATLISGFSNIFCTRFFIAHSRHKATCRALNSDHTDTALCGLAICNAELDDPSFC
jgi:hypothetical protein